MRPDVRADLPGPRGQDVKQLDARQRRESVSSGDEPLSAGDAHLHLRPVTESTFDCSDAHRVSGGEIAEGLVREHNSEPECVARIVAFEHDNLHVGPTKSHQDGEEETPWATTDTGNSHVGPPVRIVSWVFVLRVWIC